MKKFTLTILSAIAILLCLAPNSQAGSSVHFGVVVGGPVYYPPSPYYYGPYYGPGYYGYYGPRFHYWHRPYYGGYHHWH